MPLMLINCAHSPAGLHGTSIPLTVIPGVQVPYSCVMNVNCRYCVCQHNMLLRSIPVVCRDLSRTELELPICVYLAL